MFVYIAEYYEICSVEKDEDKRRTQFHERFKTVVATEPSIHQYEGA